WGAARDYIFVTVSFSGQGWLGDPVESGRAGGPQAGGYSAVTGGARALPALGAGSYNRRGIPGRGFGFRRRQPPASKTGSGAGLSRTRRRPSIGSTGPEGGEPDHHH